MNCRICGEAAKPLFEISGQHFFKCAGCGHVQRAEGYDAAIYAEDETYFDKYHNHEDYLAMSRQLLADCARLAGGTPSSRGKMLDVGSSIGIMLQAGQEHGWQPYGIEISPSAAKTSAKRGFPAVFVGALEQADYRKKSFSLVTINHVLEHMEEPLPVLKRLGDWVEDGGLLCIGVPNFGCSASRRDGSGWNGLVPDEHIQQFTPSSLQKAVEAATGFEVLHLRGNHSYGKPPVGAKQQINKLVAVAKDRLLLGRDMLLIARRSHTS